MSKMDEIDKMIEEEIALSCLPEGDEPVVESEAKSDKDENSQDDEAIFDEAETVDKTMAVSEAEISDEIDDSKKKDDSKETEALDEKVVSEADLEIEWIECEDPKKKRKKLIKKISYNLVRYAVMFMALFAFGYASYELTLIYVESKEATDNSSDTKDMFIVDLDSLEDDFEAPTNAEGETIELINKGDGQLFVFDFEKMKEYNSDSKGYIRQDNGEYIDNPILQTTDNDYYLTHLANHKKSSVGAIFIDYRIDLGLNAKNCIIYGHNMGQRVDHAMFGSLNWYYYKTGYYKEHTTFDIWIENTRYRYYVYAVFKTDAAGSDTFTYAFESDEAFMEYVNKCKSQSKYQFKEAPEITKDSMIITLVTCTHEEEKRLIVQLVRGEELDVNGNPVGAE